MSWRSVVEILSGHDFWGRYSGSVTSVIPHWISSYHSLNQTLFMSSIGMVVFLGLSLPNANIVGAAYLLLTCLGVWAGFLGNLWCNSTQPRWQLGECHWLDKYLDLKGLGHVSWFLKPKLRNLKNVDLNVHPWWRRQGPPWAKIPQQRSLSLVCLFPMCLCDLIYFWTRCQGSLYLPWYSVFTIINHSIFGSLLLIVCFC